MNEDSNLMADGFIGLDAKLQQALMEAKDRKDAFSGQAFENKQEEKIISQDYFHDGTAKKPRYYQQIAINRTVEAITKGQKRIMLYRWQCR